MSVKTLESYQEFIAVGSAYFTFNFNYADSSEIVVGMRTGDNAYEIVDPAHYVLTQNASTDGGKIRFVATKCENPDDPNCGDYVDNPPAPGTVVRIERKTVRSSTADWYVGLDMKALVSLFDKLFRITQENADKFNNTIQTFPTQQGIKVRELLESHDKKIFYWNNEKQWLDITDFTIDDVVRQTDVGDILEQANAYSDEQNAQLENRINGKLTAVNAQIDANADAIQKTREDYINADSEIHQILNNHADELTTLRGNQASLGDQVSGIEEKIPGSASATNQLATKQDLANVKVDLTGYATETYVNTREQKIRDDVNAEDSRLQSQITAQATAITTNTNNINGVKALVPSGTSTSNPLINKQQLLDEEMDIRDDLNESISELQTQITAQAAKIEEKQDKLSAGDNIVINGNVISATGAGGGTGFDAIVVQELPATGQKGIIYLVPKDGTAPDIYDEYVWITATQTFELIGTTKVDLTDYVKKTDYATIAVGGTIKISNYYGSYIFGDGKIAAMSASLETYKSSPNEYFIGKATLENAKNDIVKRAITENNIVLTDSEKQSAQAWLGIESGDCGLIIRRL